MTALLLSALLASLAGSLHCAGMCGPFTAFFTEPGRGARAPAAAWHAGRLLVYASFGAIAGAAGGAVELAAAGRLRSAAALVAGLVLVAWGTAGLLRHAGMRLPSPPAPAVLRRAASRVSAAMRGRPALQRGFATGLMTALLPCGWLHAFVLAAAATGAWWKGAALLAAFWAGTLPALVAVSAGALALLGPVRRHAPALSAATVLLAGIIALVHHAGLLASPAPCHDPNAALTRSLVEGNGG